MPPSYSCCPKCGHTPLPADQAMPAACPACGVILAKVGQPGRHSIPIPDITLAVGHNPAPHAPAHWLALLTHIPPQVDALRFWGRVCLLAGFALWGVVLIRLDYRTGDMMESFIHRPLLVFHEAGHFIFMPLGEWMTVLGGTLGQLIMPAILSGALLIRNRDPFGAAIGLWFFGVSLMDVAPYMFDALHPQLMLLSGATGEAGGHDWIYLFSSLGWLPKAPLIGGLTHKLGALVVLISVAWAAWLLWRQYPRLRDHVMHED